MKLCHSSHPYPASTIFLITLLSAAPAFVIPIDFSASPWFSSVFSFSPDCALGISYVNPITHFHAVLFALLLRRAFGAFYRSLRVHNFVCASGSLHFVYLPTSSPHFSLFLLARSVSSIIGVKDFMG
jgi:hypothetical protein